MDGIGTQRDLVRALMWCFIVQNSDEVDEECMLTVQQCQSGILSYADQRQIDDGYVLACQWLYRRAQLPMVPETDWNDQIKKEIALYEQHSKGWT